jgi:hypothetical protein
MFLNEILSGHNLKTEKILADMKEHNVLVTSNNSKIVMYQMGNKFDALLSKAKRKRKE